MIKDGNYLDDDKDDKPNGPTPPIWFLALISFMAMSLVFSVLYFDNHFVRKRIAENHEHKCATLWADFEPRVITFNNERICTIMHEGKRIPSSNATFVLDEK